MGGFLAELKRRNVIRAGLAYLALGWLLLQVAALVIPAFGWPAWVLRWLVILVALGFPATLVLAWLFDLGPGGLERDGEATAEAGARPRGRTTDRVIVAALLAVVLVLVFERVVLVGRREPAPATTPATTAAAARARPASIAVLPFVDMSQARDQEYFSDGLSEELLAALARLPQLHVAGRTSSFSFKGKDTDLRTIGERLGVATILEGSVRKAGERLRVTAQLVNAADGFRLWSETYDRELTDVFAVQDEIAAAVVDALKVKLLPGTARDFGRTANPDAYLHYLRGRALVNRPAGSDFRAAAEEFRKALELDPGYALARVSLAGALGNAQPRADSIAQTALDRRNALVEAERAIAMAPGFGQAYAVRGHLRRVINWDWAGAEEDLQRALEMGPVDVDTHLWHALHLSTLGRTTEALAALERRLELDPLSASTWRYYGLYLSTAGRLDDARTAQARALELAPGNANSHYWMGVAELIAGRPEVARRLFERTNPAERLSGIAMAESALGNEAAAQKALRELIDCCAKISAVLVAHVHARRGEKDEAFAWLQRAYDAHEDRLMYLKTNQLLDGLRDDPRYAELLKKMNLPP